MTTTARIRTYGHFAVNIYDSHVRWLRLSGPVFRVFK